MDIENAQEKRIGGGFLPVLVMMDPRIPYNVKGLYVYLASFTNIETRSCFPSVSTILSETGISDVSFNKYIGMLINQFGLIERTNLATEKYSYHYQYRLSSWPKIYERLDGSDFSPYFLHLYAVAKSNKDIFIKLNSGFIASSVARDSQLSLGSLALYGLLCCFAEYSECSTLDIKEKPILQELAIGSKNTFQKFYRELTGKNIIISQYILASGELTDELTVEKGVLITGKKAYLPFVSKYYAQCYPVITDICQPSINGTNQVDSDKKAIDESTNDRGVNNLVPPGVNFFVPGEVSFLVPRGVNNLGDNNNISNKNITEHSPLSQSSAESSGEMTDAEKNIFYNRIEPGKGLTPEFLTEPLRTYTIHKLTDWENRSMALSDNSRARKACSIYRTAANQLCALLGGEMPFRGRDMQPSQILVLVNSQISYDSTGTPDLSRFLDSVVEKFLDVYGTDQDAVRNIGAVVWAILCEKLLS